MAEEKKKTVSYRLCELVEVEEGEKRVVCSGKITAVYDPAKVGPEELRIELPTKEAMETIRETASQKIRVIHDPKIEVEMYTITEKKAETEE